jgi:putative ABC transport system permease protein
MPGLAIAYMRDRPWTTALNILLLAFAVAALVILLNFSSQLGERFERDARGVDLVVGAKGSPLQLILSSIYHVDTPTGNIPLGSVDLLRRDPAVAQVIPLALGDNFRGFRIVGTEPAYLRLYDASLAQGRAFRSDGEAVLGADVARQTGATLGQRFVGSHGLADEGASAHDEHPFTTVGILGRTGSVIDRLILVSVPSVWDVHGIEHHEEAHDAEAVHEDLHGAEAAHEEDHAEPEGAEHEAGHAAPAQIGLEPEVTALLVRYRNASGAIRIPGLVNRQTSLQAAVPAIETTRLLSLLGFGIDAARLFAWLIALIGGLSIFVTLLNAASAREGDLALLRVMGASRTGVFGTILLEGILTAAAGALIGVTLGHVALAAARGAFERLAEAGLQPFRFDPAEIGIVAFVLALGAFAALIPAVRVFRTDLARTLARAQ